MAVNIGGLHTVVDFRVFAGLVECGEGLFEYPT